MKNKIKMLILLVCVATAIITSVIYVAAVGNHYTLHTNVFLETDRVPETEVKLSNESVVQMTEARMENKELIFEFETLKPGKTTVNINYKYHDDLIPMYERTFEVNGFGTLIDRTEGNIRFN